MIGFKRMFRWLWLLALPVLLVACGGAGSDEAPAPVSSSSGGIAVGNPAPDFTLTSASGEEVSLSDYQGRPVLLFFHMAVG